MMRFDILSLFPEMFHSYFAQSMLKRAQEADLIHIALHNIRDYATDKHRMTDDTPSGGGGGMVMKPEPLYAAIQDVRQQASAASNLSSEAIPIILMTPQGRPFDQSIANELSHYNSMVLVCGRYEGIDERVRELAITDEISVGDYVLTGGELAAMIIVDAVSRLLPGVLGDDQGAAKDSHATGLLEHPHYTRPTEFMGKKVPDVLLSGHHAKIETWRRQESLRRTWQRRPDLLQTAPLTKADRRFLAELAEQSPQQPASSEDD